MGCGDRAHPRGLAGLLEDLFGGGSNGPPWLVWKLNPLEPVRPEPPMDDAARRAIGIGKHHAYFY